MNCYVGLNEYFPVHSTSQPINSTKMTQDNLRSTCRNHSTIWSHQYTLLNIIPPHPRGSTLEYYQIAAVQTAIHSIWCNSVWCLDIKSGDPSTHDDTIFLCASCSHLCQVISVTTSHNHSFNIIYQKLIYPGFSSGSHNSWASDRTSQVWKPLMKHF